MVTETFIDGKLARRTDDTTRIVTTYDASGSVTSTRPYTTSENAAADAALAEAEALAARETDRDHIVSDALVWLKNDADQAEARIAQIANAIADIDKRIEAVQNYMFTGTTVAQINTSLNNALKPQLVSMLQRQKAIGQMLKELMEARDKHGDALVWLGRLAV